MSRIAETLVGVFCWFAAGMLVTDAMATLLRVVRYQLKRREVRERCAGERTCD